MKNELLLLAQEPRDAAYLPLTMRMMASWRVKGFDQLLFYYSDSSNITPESVGLPEDAQGYFPPISAIKRDLQFKAIEGLRYYPTSESMNYLKRCIKDPDRAIQAAAKKSLTYMEKRMIKA